MMRRQCTGTLYSNSLKSTSLFEKLHSFDLVNKWKFANVFLAKRTKILGKSWKRRTEINSKFFLIYFTTRLKTRGKIVKKLGIKVFYAKLKFCHFNYTLFLRWTYLFETAEHKNINTFPVFQFSLCQSRKVKKTQSFSVSDQFFCRKWTSPYSLTFQLKNR